MDLRIVRLATTVALAMLLAACGPSPEEALANQWPILDRYCTDCHNDAERAGEMSLERVTPAEVAQNPELFEQIVKRLRGAVMPPPGAAHPGPEQVNEFVAALERSLDAAAGARGPTPGRVSLHRLNRVEYAATVEGLLGVSIDAKRLLPPDATADGFDNVAEVLRVTPTYLDQYIAAARDVSLRAVGSPAAKLARAEYPIMNKNRTAHVDGLPLGTRDGAAIEHYFPSDGTYSFNIDVNTDPGAELRAYPHGWLEYEHTVILTIDGVKLFEDKLGGEHDLRELDRQQIVHVNAIKARFRDIKLPVKAGYHEVAATFVARSRAQSDFVLHSLVPGEGVPDVPQISGLEIVGPYDPSGVSQTRSRERVFSCYPKNAGEERPCAERIVNRIARLAFRGPVEETHFERLMKFYDDGHASGGFETGIQRSLLAILSSTRFLYRSVTTPDGVAPGAAHPLTDLELATRLAFFLWSQGPDDTLLDLAESNRLGEPDVYAQQVSRMLADPRAEALITNFAFQWLSVRNLEVIDPDPRLYPNFDNDLRAAFVEEMRLYLDSILRDDERSVVDLLTADHTFVNERLARHYGLADIRGAQFRRVQLADRERWGIFGKGSVLMATSLPDRTSPVLRGAWIMEHVLGVPPTPPPPGVETNLTPVATEAPKSVRQRLALHREASSCNHCHGVIDPLGQALENYNAVGEWRDRERDTGVPVDPAGSLANGIPVQSPTDLREAIVAEPEKFVQTLVEHLLTYALGRSVEHYDMPAVRKIVRDAADHDYTFAAIVMGVADSVPFRMRSAPDATSETTVAAAPGE
jgi:hypothetical protein